MEGKRPRFLWIVVVAVVAAALAVFVLVRSNRMEPQVAEVRPEQQVQVDQPQDSGTRSWPAPDTTMARERPEVKETASEVMKETTPTREARRKPRRPAKPSVTTQTTDPSAPLVLPTSDTAAFVVQVGSYKDERIARIQIERMKKHGYSAWVESADIPGKGRYYRLRIGGFEILADAERVAKSMSAVLGNECWVDNR